MSIVNKPFRDFEYTIVKHGYNGTLEDKHLKEVYELTGKDYLLFK